MSLNRITLRTSAELSSEIFIGAEINSIFAEYVATIQPARILYFVDKNLKEIFQTFTPSAILEDICWIDVSEKTKTLESFEQLLQFLYDHNADKKTLVVSFGGGALSDAVGFLTSVYNRGVPYISVPTTLLSQVDAALGGKNALNFAETKNVLGSIYFPRAIFIDTVLLETLPEREYISGFGEILKYAIGFDEHMFGELEQTNPENIDNTVLHSLVSRCIQHKIDVVNSDFNEEKLKRTLLNLGHTLGQALESNPKYKLTHGEAVAVGTLFAAFVSQKRDLLEQQDVDRVLSLMQQYNMPKLLHFDCPEMLDKMKHDKKRRGDIIRFVVLSKIGIARTEDISFTELEEYLNDFANWYVTLS